MSLDRYKVKEIRNLKVWGRTTASMEPLTLFWTGSAVECNVRANELWVEVEADYETYEPWMSIMINGAYVSRLMLNKGKQWICLFRGMNKEQIKNVKIVKEVQAMSEDERHCLQIHEFKINGTFLPVEEKPYKLEFIGDSITSGEGSIGAVLEEDWISMWFSTQNNYAHMVAAEMDAEYRIISQSGWGVYTGWDNNPYSALPLYYEKVCGLLKGEKNESLGALQAYDFKKWQPDAIIINLGTNDGSAFNSPEWRDEKTGESHKQRLNEDGSFHEADLKKFEEAAYAFIVKVRKNNPYAQIVWAYGMLGYSMLESIKRVVRLYKNLSGDEKICILKLPETNTDTVGARRHPGVLSHQIAAKCIVDQLKNMNYYEKLDE